LKQAQPVHLGHVDVGQEQIEALAPNSIQSAVRSAYGDRDIILAREDFGAQMLDVLLIVDDQYLLTGHRPLPMQLENLDPRVVATIVVVQIIDERPLFPVFKDNPNDAKPAGVLGGPLFDDDSLPPFRKFVVNDLISQF
jgi:hypothetical protein